MSKKTIIFSGVVVVVIGIVTYFAFAQPQQKGKAPEVTAENGAVSSVSNPPTASSSPQLNDNSPTASDTTQANDFYLVASSSPTKLAIANQANIVKFVVNPYIFSPNGDYKIVEEKYEDGNETYIANSDGSKLTAQHSGSFIAWAPDSSKALLYLPIEATGIDERKIYYLGVDGSYTDSGLPPGTSSADISSVDGSIVYTLTNSKTDDSDLYIKSPQGESRLLVKGNHEIFAWPRWSPDGTKIAFLRTGIGSGGSALFVIDVKGTQSEKISNADWNYGAVWSKDSSILTFEYNGYIWSYVF